MVVLVLVEDCSLDIIEAGVEDLVDDFERFLINFDPGESIC